MNEIMDFYTVECYCGINHKLRQNTNTKITCICGRSVNGLFGVEFQRKMEEQTRLMLIGIQVGLLAMFTTEELADEVARRVKEAANG